VSSQEQLKFNFFKNHQDNLNFYESYTNSLFTDNLFSTNIFDNIFLENHQDNYKLIDSSFDINLNTRLKNKKIY
jgi:hypothetical protein